MNFAATTLILLIVLEIASLIFCIVVLRSTFSFLSKYKELYNHKKISLQILKVLFFAAITGTTIVSIYFISLFLFYQ